MVWGRMLWDGPGYACKIDGRMDGDLFTQVLDDELQENLAHYSNLLRTSSFSKIMSLNIPVKGTRMV